MTQPPRMDVTSVTIGAPDPRALAAFYARMLDWPIAVEEPARPGCPPEDGWAQMSPPAGKTGPTLNFEYEAAYSPPVWPSEAGRQHITAHLDIAVEDLEAAVAWAVESGAAVASCQPQEDVRVMLDPAGHPFCLFLDLPPGAAGRRENRGQPVGGDGRAVTRPDLRAQPFGGRTVRSVAEQAPDGFGDPGR